MCACGWDKAGKYSNEKRRGNTILAAFASSSEQVAVFGQRIIVLIVAAQINEQAHGRRQMLLPVMDDEEPAPEVKSFYTDRRNLSAANGAAHHARWQHGDAQTA